MSDAMVLTRDCCVVIVLVTKLALNGALGVIFIVGISISCTTTFNVATRFPCACMSSPKEPPTRMNPPCRYVQSRANTKTR